MEEAFCKLHDELPLNPDRWSDTGEARSVSTKDIPSFWRCYFLLAEDLFLLRHRYFWQTYEVSDRGMGLCVWMHGATEPIVEQFAV